MVLNADTTKQKLLSVLCHGSIFLGATFISIVIPLAIYFISDNEVVRDNAREAINFHFNIWAYGIVFGILIWVLIGYLLLGILGVANIVLPVLAILSVWNDPYKPYRYPFIWRVL